MHSTFTFKLKNKLDSKPQNNLIILENQGLFFYADFTGILIVKNTSSTLMAMMMIACNRYILIVRGRALYDKVYTKRNTALSIVAVSQIDIPTSSVTHSWQNATCRRFTPSCFLSPLRQARYHWRTIALLYIQADIRVFSLSNSLTVPNAEEFRKFHSSSPKKHWFQQSFLENIGLEILIWGN